MQNQAINPLSQNNMGNIKQMINLIKGKNNPNQMLQMLAQQNPQVSQIMNMLNGSHMSPKQLFMQTAQQRGIDPNTIQRQIAECCCDNRLATANLSAQMDRQTCDITSAIHAEGEATRALMQTNEIQALRDKVSSLEMDSRMYGVVRYPNGFVYNAGNSPFCGCNGCGV